MPRKLKRMRWAKKMYEELESITGKYVKMAKWSRGHPQRSI